MEKKCTLKCSIITFLWLKVSLMKDLKIRSVFDNTFIAEKGYNSYTIKGDSLKSQESRHVT